MRPAERLPQPGEIWVGGENAGHPPSRVRVQKVSSAMLTIRFLSGHKPSGYKGEHCRLRLAHFLLHFRPQ